MYQETPRPPHVQRCTFTEVRGGRLWQCLEQDPHPDKRHRLPVDAEYGRDLDVQRPDWLAGTLRDKTVLIHHLERRLDDLQGIAIEVLRVHTEGGEPNDRAREWARNVAPGAARTLGWI
jgi:hypothetical protein